jgi:outer membrane lipopolysaccharide assembly protein LptE/RlpB
MLGVLGVLLSACGYRFAGGEPFPEGIRTLFIPVLENRTTETGVEQTFTDDLRQEFIRYDRFRDRHRAEGVLTGVVSAMRIDPVSRRGSDVTLEQRVIITLNFTLSAADGRVVWSAENVSDNETYPVAADKLVTEQNRRNAIKVLSKRLAERTYDRLTDAY